MAHTSKNNYQPQSVLLTFLLIFFLCFNHSLASSALETTNNASSPAIADFSSEDKENLPPKILPRIESTPENHAEQALVFPLISSQDYLTWGLGIASTLLLILLIITYFTLRERRNQETILRKEFEQQDSFARHTQQMSLLQSKSIHAQAKVEELNQRLRMVFDVADDPMCLIAVEIGKTLRIVSANQAYLRALNLSSKQLVGRKIEDVFKDNTVSKALNDKIRESIQARQAVIFPHIVYLNDQTLEWETTLTPIFDELNYCTHIHLVAHQRQTQDQTRSKWLQKANYDIVTGLPNQVLLQQHLQALLPHASSNPFIYIQLEIDNLHVFNQEHTHLSLDQTLQNFAQRLRINSGESDIMARSEDNQFILILDGALPKAELYGKLNTLIHKLNQPFICDTIDWQAEVRLGIVYVSSNKYDPSLLHEQAQLTLHQARLENLPFGIYSAHTSNTSIERLGIYAGLREAISKQQFFIHYQPIYRTNSHKNEQNMMALEACLYWQVDSKTHLPAAQFLPYAKEAGLLGTIQAWLIEHACRQFSHWRNNGMAADINLNINIDLQSLALNEWINCFEHANQDYAIPHHKITLEVCEKDLVENSNALHVLRGLSKLGLQFAVEDFGTGHSALTALTRFPLNYLKLSPSLIRETTMLDTEGSILQSLIKMAEGLKIIVIADGVESVAQALFLQQSGCILQQGLLYSAAQDGPTLEAALLKPRLKVMRNQA